MLFDAAPREERERSFDSRLEADPAENRLLFRYAGTDGALPPWGTLWAIPAAGAPGRPLALDRVGLRSYRSREPLGEAERFRRVLIAEDADGARPLLTAGFAVPLPDEALPLPPRWDGVRRIVEQTGGAWVSGPEELRTPPPLVARLPVAPAVLVIAISVLLLLAEVLVRTLWEE
jgi:hypothetical protein